MTRTSEELLIRHCSPTLAGLKTGNIFTCAVEDRETLYRDLRELNRMLSPKGLRILPLRHLAEKAMLYLFRPAHLASDLEDPRARRILNSCGYCTDTVNGCLIQMMQRMRRLEGNRSFPHEIGLFLGYPPEDVRGFIENGAEGCKFSGCWKVYDDEEQARKIFDRFRKCTRVYTRQLTCGKSLDRLAVSV